MIRPSFDQSPGIPVEDLARKIADYRDVENMSKSYSTLERRIDTHSDSRKWMLNSITARIIHKTFVFLEIGWRFKGDIQ